VKRPSIDEARRFIVTHTALARPPIVPEIVLHLATESTALWRATEAWLEQIGLAPPYWAFAWVGGQALARFVLDHPEHVAGRVVVDFGAGSGLVALAAKRAGAAQVIAVDRDPVALVACRLNAAANDLELETREAETLGELAREAGAEVVLAGDVFYERKDAASITMALAVEAARGLTVLAGCPGRAYTPDATVLARIDVNGALELEGRERRPTQVLRF
jgi:predicted nicotinamide N-methyase